MSVNNPSTEDNTMETSPIETDTNGAAEARTMPTQGNMPSPIETDTNDAAEAQAMPAQMNMPSSSGIYVQVPRDVPAQPAGPQPPSGPSKATIVLSLLPLFFGVVVLMIAGMFPLNMAPIAQAVDVPKLLILSMAVLGMLLVVLAALLGLSSLKHHSKETPRSEQGEE